MKLNIRAQTAQNQHNNSPIVLVHGLFGSLDNLGVLARDLVNDHNIIEVDMRNHGLSPRDPVMNYPAMAQDLVDTPMHSRSTKQHLSVTPWAVKR